MSYGAPPRFAALESTSNFHEDDDNVDHWRPQENALRTYEDKVDYTFSEFARERIAFGGSGEQWVPATVIKDPGSNQNFIQNDYLTRDLRVSERKPYRGNAVDTIAGPVMPSGTVTLPCARQPRSQYMFSGPKPDLRETEREYQVSGRMNYIISVPKPGYSYPMEEGNPVDFHIIDTNGKWGHAILGREARYEREDPQAFWSHKPKETPTPNQRRDYQLALQQHQRDRQRAAADNNLTMPTAPNYESPLTQDSRRAAAGNNFTMPTGPNYESSLTRKRDAAQKVGRRVLDKLF